MWKTISIGVISVVAMASAAYADTRGEAEQMVTGSCQVSQEDCMTTVRTLIADTVQCTTDDPIDMNEGCGCAPNRAEVLQGLGDAAQTLGRTNIEVARLIELEVGGAPACYASAGTENRRPVGGSPG